MRSPASHSVIEQASTSTFRTPDTAAPAACLDAEPAVMNRRRQIPNSTGADRDSRMYCRGREASWRRMSRRAPQDEPRFGAAADARAVRDDVLPEHLTDAGRHRAVFRARQRHADEVSVNQFMAVPIVRQLEQFLGRHERARSWNGHLTSRLSRRGASALRIRTSSCSSAGAGRALSSRAPPPAGAPARCAAPVHRTARRGNAPAGRRRGRATGRSTSSGRPPRTCSTPRAAPGRTPCR